MAAGLIYLGMVDSLPYSATVGTNPANVIATYYKTIDTARNLYDVNGVALNMTWNGFMVASAISSVFVLDAQNQTHTIKWNGADPLPIEPTSPTIGGNNGVGSGLLGSPQSVIAAATSDTQIVVLWSAVTAATFYTVEKSEDNTTWAVIDNTVAVTSTIKMLTAEKKYYFRVIAHNTTLNSIASTVVNATTLKAGQTAPAPEQPKASLGSGNGNGLLSTIPKWAYYVGGGVLVVVVVLVIVLISKKQ
jgi:hypothetical protein